MSKFANHYPENRYYQFLKIRPIIFPNVVRVQPLEQTRLVFTDGSSKGYVAGSSTGYVAVLSDNIIERVRTKFCPNGRITNLFACFKDIS